MGKIVILEDEDQLRELARLIRRQEEEAIHKIDFHTESERVQYLKDCKASYESTIAILDAAGEAKEKFKDDEKKGPIAHDAYEYALKGVNTSLQVVKNYYLRLDYVNKLKAHHVTILEAIAEADPLDVVKINEIAQEAKQYREAADKFLDKYQSGLSKKFADKLKRAGTTFEEMIEKYQRKLHFSGEFEKLEPKQKIKVLNLIAEESGTGEILPGMVDKLAGIAGQAVLVFMLGTMAWDIFSSAHPIETATRDAAMLAANVAGGEIDAIVTAIASAMAEEAGITTAFATLAGFVTGLAGAVIIAAVSGVVIDLIFSSGGRTPFSAEGHRGYVVQVPDGVALARQIAYDHKHKN